MTEATYSYVCTHMLVVCMEDLVQIHQTNIRTYRCYAYAHTCILIRVTQRVANTH
jgi:hypothetical protein